MADLNIETARWCQSNEIDSTVINGYTLTYGKHNPGPYSANWDCNCKGYQFRKTCKHIAEAEEKRCGFGWEAAAGSPIDMGKTCPSCGGPTCAMRYAV